jgi:hypothetical protein
MSKMKEKKTIERVYGHSQLFVAHVNEGFYRITPCLINFGSQSTISVFSKTVTTKIWSPFEDGARQKNFRDLEYFKRRKEAFEEKPGGCLLSPREIGRADFDV